MNTDSISRPIFKEALHVGRPNIGNQEALLERFHKILSSRWLTNNGEMVRDLENQLACFLGVNHCIAVSNATIGLELAIRALDLRGEIIVPAFTFIATSHACQWMGLKPVFADVCSKTHLMDLEDVEKLINPRTQAILPVHTWGQPCRPIEYQDLAKQAGLKLIFDGAHAFACLDKGTYLGGFGDCEVFSFHATKFFNSFEGGAITTNNSQLAERLTLMRNFGFAGTDEVVSIGTNAKMSEIHAAMGLTSFESLDHFLAINRRNYEKYRECLNGIPGISLLTDNHTSETNSQYIVLDVDEDICTLPRDVLISWLHYHKIMARRYFWPGCHNMEPYRSTDPKPDAMLPGTTRSASGIIVLPTGEAVSPSDIEMICYCLRMAVDKPYVVREVLDIRL